VAELSIFCKNSKKPAQISGRQNCEEDKFHAENTRTLGATLKNTVVQAILRLRFANSFSVSWFL